LIAFAAGFNGEEPMAVGDAAEVLVGNGDGMAESVEEDGVGGFGADTGKRKKAAAKLLCWSGGKLSE